MRYALKNNYPGIIEKSGCSCGGNQMLLQSSTLRRFGCGAVAALDLLRYLHLYHIDCQSDLFSGIPDKHALPFELYSLCVQRITHSYVPILPHLATNGVFLSAGLNAYFRHYGLPLRAYWGTSQDELWPSVSRMLQSDIPVILGIGKSIKHLPGVKRLDLYRKEGGEFKAVRQVSGHFLTILGQDDEWLYVSSWGREYAVNRWELMHYARTESASFLCSILQIFPKF
ncbi:MAG: hypothetical protein E7446_09065 [Ruminococcaceae bacterium]|nr:hypothetical protein [Oscillospiraceae bacterium]